MDYNELKNEVDSVINGKHVSCDGDIVTADELIMYMNDRLSDVYDMLDDDTIVDKINRSHGYNGCFFKRVEVFKNHPVPYISKITYSTFKEKDGNIISISFIDETNLSEYILNIFKENGLEEFDFALQYDNSDSKVDIDFLKNYIPEFLGEIRNMLFEKFAVMENFKGVIRDSKIEFDEAVQQINSGVFKITYNACDTIYGVSADISFSDDEREKTSNALWLSRPSIKKYINDRKEFLLGKLPINIEDLNDFYKSNVRASIEEEMQLRNIN